MIDSDGVRSDGLRDPEVSAHGDIELDDVNFAYPTRPGVQVLKNFSAKFAKGKTTALVGPSGSGKSTVVALLERWYELQTQSNLSEGKESLEKGAENVDADGEHSTKQAICNGSISTGGHKISDFNLKWWRSQIGLVQQDPFLFNDTIEQNVAYGLTGTEWEHVDATTRLNMVKDACKEAFADEFVSKLSKVFAVQRHVLLIC